MFHEDLNTLQAEAYDHLWNGRFRLALNAAEKVYQSRPDDSEAAICYAWALLENGSPIKAMEYANLAVELKGESIRSRIYRAYLLSRMSIFEGAIADFDLSIENQKDILAWTYLNKSRSLAGLQKFEEANNALDLALIIDDNKNPSWKEMRDWIIKALQISRKDPDYYGDTAKVLEDAERAIKVKEYWFALLASRAVLENKKNEEAEIYELEAMLYLFQLKPALKKANSMASRFKKNEKFAGIFAAIKKFSQLEQESEVTFEQRKKLTQENLDRLTKTLTTASLSTNYKTDFFPYPNDDIKIISLKLFDDQEELKPNSRNFYKVFNQSVKSISAEIIFENPFYDKEDKLFECTAVWYLNDFEISRNNFNLSVKKDLESGVITQQCGTEKSNGWKIGQARVEIYINNFKVCAKNFGIGNAKIPEEEKQIPSKTKTESKASEISSTTIRQPRTTKSLDELMAEFELLTGLSSIKEAIKSFIAYLEFLKERKRFGLKADDRISINAVFLGNPGTGKTTIARMLGEIFYAMGILPNGHVVEVDRSAIVGQYVGETAQKTEKVINDAMGGILFIDEAYTLIKKGGAQDFGQEAIDIILKRMEDRKGEFVVIAAGYPAEMESFLNSNPGLKSRFTHTFVFEDYTPDELLTIFQQLLKKEDYKLTHGAEEILKKELIALYRNRDKSFGNARLVKKLFEEAKLNLSRYYQKIPYDKRDESVITTFSEDVIKSIFAKKSSTEVKLPINEEALAESLNELNNLVGLNLLKKEVDEMIKLARFFNEQGDDIRKIFNQHISFLGNPGTGKTTVARILGRIYSALGILHKGHIIETDRQGLVAGYVGQTAEKTTAMIDRAIGGMLFIDEAYSLIKPNDSGNDFGKEAIDILLKRMEDDRGRFLVIAAGYTNEMLNFIASNPGMQSRFSKSFTFEDYTPKELMEIVKRSLEKDKKLITKEAQERLEKYFEELYKGRDKKFGNARIVRNILESVKHKMLLRLSGIPSESRTEESTNTIELVDINEVLDRDVEAKQFEVKGDPLRLQEHINELNQLINLENVKKDIYKLISFSKISQLKKERGLQSPDRNLHSIFIGNPGTGKRTVTRLIGKIYKELGILSNGHVVEVERADLVASYQDESALKTDKIIQQAIGGILYIKEVHSLFSDEDPYGHESIEIILRRLNDYKGKLVVVLSTTNFEINKILKANPGLSSYFPNKFFFEDYTPRQRLAIAAITAEKNGYTLDEGALQEILDLFDKLCARDNRSFQNGITAKNILYSAITNQEERIFGIYDQKDVDLTTITLDDVQKIKI